MRLRSVSEFQKNSAPRLPRTLATLTLFALSSSLLRADIYASTQLGAVYSFDQWTGANKLTIQGGPLAVPIGVAIGADGRLYVADNLNKEVLQYNASTGSFLGTFVATIPGIAYPAGITFGPNGDLYMADNSGYIRSFSSTGAPLQTASCASPAGGACFPWDLAFGPDGNLYVSDLATRTVVKMNGSNLAWMGTFVVAISTNLNALPYGLHFGSNGNLYVAYSFPTQSSSYNEIFEYNGSNGDVIAFQVLELDAVQTDFAFDPSGSLVVAGDSPVLALYSGSNGKVIGSYGPASLPLSPVSGLITIGTPAGSFGNPRVIYPPIPITNFETLRLTVVDGPIRVPPGVPVEALLGFTNLAGQPIGPTKTVTLNPNQMGLLDFPGSSVVSSGNIEVIPTVSFLPGTIDTGSLSGSVEVYTTSNGVGTVFSSGITVPPFLPITGQAYFVPQGVVLGVSLEISALAPPNSPCTALLSFTDVNGSPVGPTAQVNLSPGTGQTLVFNPNSLDHSGRQEYLPQITPNNPTGAAGPAPSCIASAAAFGQKTGQVLTYQALTPPVATQ